VPTITAPATITAPETITAAHNEAWIVFNAGGPMFATGAPVSGFNQVGAFFTGEVVPGSNNCTYGDVDKASAAGGALALDFRFAAIA